MDNEGATAEVIGPVDTSAALVAAEAVVDLNELVSGPSCGVCGKTEFKTVDGVIAMTGPDADGYCHACDTTFFTLEELAATAPASGTILGIFTGIAQAVAASNVPAEAA